MKVTCECIECGHKEETEGHCTDKKCPKCGGTMRREDRPGPGQKQNALTPDQIDKWVTLFKKGQSNKEIAEKFKTAYGIETLTKGDRDKLSTAMAKSMTNESPFHTAAERRNAGTARYGTEIKNYGSPSTNDEVKKIMSQGKSESDAILEVSRKYGMSRSIVEKAFKLGIDLAISV